MHQFSQYQTFLTLAVTVRLYRNTTTQILPFKSTNLLYVFYDLDQINSGNLLCMLVNHMARLLPLILILNGFFFPQLPVLFTCHDFSFPFAAFASVVCGLSPPLVLSGVILFSLNKRPHKPFTPVALITFIILLSTFLLTKAVLTFAIQQNRRSVDQSRSKQMVLSTLHCHPHFESFRVSL